ncbi:MAG: 4-(cytidine 5'-diphospho)-2-C-methyl-D-erythritol kinase [Opitutales bacterium]
METRPPTSEQLTWRCPAKLNLRLAVVGRREDGFHELRSLVAPISLADHLTLEWAPETGDHTLRVEGTVGDEVPGDADNLVSRALQAFAAAHPFPGRLHLTLHKRIPAGAGLGGGSSDAAGTLLALQTLWHHPLEPADLEAMALRLGADVPFFLRAETALMRGAGEELTPSPTLAARLRGLTCVVFKPSFGVSTGWAYEALASARAYQDAREEDAALAALEAGTRRLLEAPFNAFRAVVDTRFPAIPVLLAALNRLPGVRAEMSGSGSACFALAHSPAPLEAICQMVREAWGEEVFLETVRIA